MKTLYTGLTIPPCRDNVEITHCPLIRVAPQLSPTVVKMCRELDRYTHILFTSKSAVRFFLDLAPADCTHLIVLSIGKATTGYLNARGLHVQYTASEQTSEGVATMLAKIDLQTAHLFWPHAVRSRPVIANELRQQQVRCSECYLYDTFPVVPEPVPDLAIFDEVIFTSPSTVDAFFSLYPSIPKNLHLHAIGPITQAYLSAKRVCGSPRTL